MFLPTLGKQLKTSNILETSRIAEKPALCPSTKTRVLAGTLGRVVSVDLQSKVTTVKWKGQQICTGMWTPPITTY